MIAKGHRTLVVVLSLVTPLALAAQRRPTGPARASFAEPGISPDGREIAFASGGDIWAVPTSGGDARLLVSHPAFESRPLYSPDGGRLAFISTRSGNADIWVLTFATGGLRRLTFDDGAEFLDAWSSDGKWIYFSSSAHDIGTSDEYRVSADGGTPMTVAADRYASEFMGAPSPDGSMTAIVARGMAQSQWWRKGRSHLDESELWLVTGDGSAAPLYRQLTQLGAKRQWPIWSPDGHTLYYVSDEGGVQNLWRLPIDGAAAQLTHFRDGRVLFPSITKDGKTIAFERDFAIWMASTATGEAKAVPIALRGSVAGTPDEHLVLTTFQDLALSPDGKKIAVTARGDVFALSATDGGDAARVTRTPSIEAQLTWAPDSRRLAYVGNRDGAWHLFTYDFTTRSETQLTRGDKSDQQPRWSPDGKQIAFVRDGRELHVIGGDGTGDRVVASGTFTRPPFMPERGIVWSPDGKFIAYAAGGTKLMVNAYVVPAGGTPSAAAAGDQVSFLSNTGGGALAWSPDGRYLLIQSSMRTEPGIVARVDLVPHVPRLREALFDALFRDETPGRTTPAAPAPMPPSDSARPATTTPATPSVRVVTDGIRERLTVLPIGLDVTTQAISPDGKSLLVVSSAAGQQNIYVYSLDELATDPPVARQVTATAGGKSNVQWAPDSKAIWYLEQGRISNVVVDTRAVKSIAARAELDVDFEREKMEVFHQAWEFLNDNFYDPAFHGTNWNAVHEAYAPVIAGSRTPDEMRRLLSLMIGEMNASHMGISGPQAPATSPRPATGRLGLEFDRSVFERRGVLQVSKVIALSPAAISERIHAGDVLVAVDGERIGPHTSLDSLLGYKVGKRVVLTVTSPGSATPREVSVLAASANTERGLLYREWVASRRAYVDKISNGKLGYVHMADMGGGAIAQMNLDLDSEMHGRTGIVLDIRNNNGGFVNGSALDILSRQPYVVMVRRGVPAVPGRPVLGQRALEAPSILVTNQATLSDGENFTEGYRTMKLGTVVGEPTAGWDVYTSAGTMVDGTTVRLPFMRNGQLDGTPLELRPRAVDIPVERPMGESYTMRDTQLDAAVRALLDQMNGRRADRR
jgi:Tol biopolymer transport system component/C-terminal processing protease CtpA/Prc